MRKTLRIATRKSPLAVWQAEAVKQQLLVYYPDVQVELIFFVTQGDKIIDRSLSKIGGKGLFVKELENALLNHEADIAVHSMKDVPMHLPQGLEMIAMVPRGSVEDVFVSEKFSRLEDMPKGTRIGTSSARRKAILQRDYAHLQAIDVRGNVQTRLQKCASGEVDALILAAAGLERLDLSDKITQRLSADQWLPAPGQGAIGIEARQDDVDIKQLLHVIHHVDTWDTVIAERAVSRALNGGCGVPLAAYAVLEKDELWLRAWIENDNQHRAFAEMRASRMEAEVLGKKVAEQLCY